MQQNHRSHSSVDVWCCGRNDHRHIGLNHLCFLWPNLLGWFFIPATLHRPGVATWLKQGAFSVNMLSINYHAGYLFRERNTQAWTCRLKHALQYCMQGLRTARQQAVAAESVRSVLFIPVTLSLSTSMHFPSQQFQLRFTAWVSVLFMFLVFVGIYSTWI